jgi:hypothetical protein
LQNRFKQVLRACPVRAKIFPFRFGFRQAGRMVNVPDSRYGFPESTLIKQITIHKFNGKILDPAGIARTANETTNRVVLTKKMFDEMAPDETVASRDKSFQEWILPGILVIDFSGAFKYIENVFEKQSTLMARRNR